VDLLRTPAGRRVFFAALYASEGAPIGYIWWALPAKLRAAGVPVEQITAITATLVLPWALKFLWAPAVDLLRGPRWGRRAWIVAPQIGMGLTLVPLVFDPTAGGLSILTALLLLHAFFAATQDAAVDALCIATVPPVERGSLNGWMQVGMLSARAVFGGFVLTIEGYLGERFTFIALLAFIWSTTALVLLARPPAESVQAAGRRLAALAAEFGRTLLRVVRRRSTLCGLLFAATGGAAFEAVGAVASPLLVDQQVPQATIGAFFGLPVVLCMAGGALLGGWVSDRIGRRVGVVVAGVLIAATVAGLGIVVSLGGAPTAVMVNLGVVYVLIGVFTATTYALFMDLTEPALGATQFSAFMGATNLCEAWAAFAVGRLAAGYGYGPAFIAVAVASLAALVLLLGMRPQPGATRR
jgi:PAT family beta-lactamase induction signal transducer AmpG